MLILDHLSESDKKYVLDKTAKCLAQILAQQQKGEVVYDGQSAVAGRLGRSRATVAKLMAEGRLEFSRVGTKGYQFTEAQVQTYLAAA